MKRKLLILCFLLTTFHLAFSQNKTVKGVVTSASDGMPVVAAYVFVFDENTTQSQSVGVSTDLDGRFSLTVAQNVTKVKVQCIGFEDQVVTIPAGGEDLSIVLKTDAIALDNSIVTGYSTSTKRSFVGTASVVNAADIRAKAASNISASLVGESAGVNVVVGSGQPGDGASVYVRGIGSVNGSTAPLYIVDGVPYGGGISTINPQDIESITLLKDAASTAIYGARGANGVIVIKTKQGGLNDKQGIVVNVEQTFGTNVDQLARYDVIKSPEQYIGLMWSGLRQYAADNGIANPVDYANNNLFIPVDDNGRGIKEPYNMWVGTPEEFIDPVTGTVRAGTARKYTPEDWESYAFRPAFKSETNVNMSGGNSRISYYASVGYLNEKGYAIKSGFERLTSRLAVNASPLKWVKLGLTGAFSTTRYEAGGHGDSSVNLFYTTRDVPSIYPLFLRDEEGNLVPDDKNGGYVFDFGDKYSRSYAPLSNAVGQTILGQDYSNTHNLSVIGNADFRITDWLSFENKYQYNQEITFGVFLANKYYGQSSSGKGELDKSFNSYKTVTGLNMLRFNKRFGKHSTDAFVAHEISIDASDLNSVAKKNLIFPQETYLNNAIEALVPPSGSYSDLRLESYFGQLNYSFDDKYFAMATVRRDGSSRFKNNKWGNFYSLGGAWMISNENFMKDVSWIKELKLKASYGTLGSQAGISLYSGNDLYSIRNLSGLPSFTFASKGNPDLTWEKSSMFQTGVEFNISDIVEGSIDFYNKVTSDMLYDTREAPSTGVAIVKKNDGKLLNRGFEFDFTVHALRNKEYYLDFRLNGAHNTNKILRMPIDPGTGKPKIFDSSAAQAEGYSLGEQYLAKSLGVNSDTGEEEYEFIFADLDGDGVYSADKDDAIYHYYAELKEHPEYLEKNQLVSSKTTNISIATRNFRGNSLPVLKGSFLISGGWRNISLRTQFLYSIGGLGYDSMYSTYLNTVDNTGLGDKNFHVDIEKRWKQPGDITNIPKFTGGYRPSTRGVPVQNQVRRGGSTRFLTSASYLQIANVRIGYKLPKKIVDKLKLGSLEVFASGDNLWVFSARKGYNPSVSLFGSTNQSAYVPMTTYTCGLRLSF